MKKVSSGFLAVIVAIGLLITGGAFMATAGGPSLHVKMVDDYNTGGSGVIWTKDDGNFTAAGGQRSFALTGKPNLPLATGHLGDTRNADYALIYVRWDSSDALAIAQYGVDAGRCGPAWMAHVLASGNTTTATYTDWYSTDGRNWSDIAFNRSPEPEVLQNDGTWKKSSTIPADYEGYVRVGIPEASKLEDCWGLYFRFGDWGSTDAAGTLYLDKLMLGADLTATTGEFGMTFEAARLLPSDAAAEEEALFVKTVDSYNTGSSGVIWTKDDGNFTAAGGQRSFVLTGKPNVPTATGHLGDTRNADYVLIYVRWDSSDALAIAQYGVDAGRCGAAWMAHVLASGNTTTATYTDWYAEGRDWSDIAFNRSPEPEVLQNDGTWEKSSTIPAGYEGYVRVGIPEASKLEDCWGLYFRFGDWGNTAAAGTLYLDKLMLGADLTGATEEFGMTFEAARLLPSDEAADEEQVLFVDMINDYTANKADAISKGHPSYIELGQTSWVAEKGRMSLELAGKGFNTHAEEFFTGRLGDATDADYIMLYVKWDGNVDLKIQRFGVDAGNSNEEWKAHVEANGNKEEGSYPFWMAFNPAWVNDIANNQASLLELFDGDDWSDAAGKIPAGFEGYLRVAIPNESKTADLWGLYVRFEGTDDAMAGTLTFDNLMLAKIADAADAKYDMTFEAARLIANNEGERDMTVKIINDFETQAQADQIKSGNYLYMGDAAWSWIKNMTTASNGVKKMLSGTYDGGTAEPYQGNMIETKLGDTRDADYVILYVAWDGEESIGFRALIDAGYLTADYLEHMKNVSGFNYDFWKNGMDQGWGDYAGIEMICEYFLDDSWRSMQATDGYHTIPAKYEGYIRMTIPQSAKRADVWGLAFTLKGLKEASYTGTFFADDLLLAKTATDTDSVYAAKFSLFAKTSGLAGGNVDPDGGSAIPPYTPEDDEETDGPKLDGEEETETETGADTDTDADNPITGIEGGLAALTGAVCFAGIMLMMARRKKERL